MKKIDIKGPIISNNEKWIYDFLGMDSAAPKDVTDALPDDGSDVEIDLNSNGGLVTAGSEIYTALMSYQGKVTINIVGMAASAASVIAMAGNPTRISPVGQIMIHNSAAQAYGDYRDHDQLSGVLKQMNSTMANAYQLKTKLPMDDLLAKMDSETYLSADQAKELGFADEIMFADDKIKLVADGGSGILPQTAIDKIAELVKPAPNLSDSDVDRISNALASKLNSKSKEQLENKFVNPFAL